MRHYIKEIGLHGAIYSISNILTKALGIFLIPIYASYLTQKEYGIISLINPMVNGLFVIYTFGMQTVWMRYFFDFEDRSVSQKKFFGNIFLILVFFTMAGNIILSFFGKPLFNKILPGVDFSPYILLGLWTSISIVFIEIQLNLFRIRKQSIRYGVFSILKFLGIILISIFCITYLRMGALGKIFSEFLVSGIFLIISLVYLSKNIILNINFNSLRQIFRYALPVVPHTLSGIVIVFAGKYFINLYEGLDSTGIYNLGFLIGSVMNIITVSINYSWQPFFLKTAKEKGEEAKQVFSQLTTYYWLFICLISLAIILFSREIILLLANKSYIEAAKIVPIIVISYTINGFYFMMVSKIIYVKSAIKFLPIATISSAIINVILSYLLVPVYGRIGAAIAALMSSLVITVITYFFSQKAYPIKYETKRLLIISVITLTIVLSLIIINRTFENSLILFALKFLLLIIFVASIWILKILRPSEIMNLKDIYNKVFNKIKG